MIMYSIYNSDTLTELIETVHRMQNTTSWRERTSAGKLNQWLVLYLHKDGMHYYAINSILFLTSIREKYVKMYERFLEQMKMYAKVIRILSKGYLPISLLPLSNLERILNEVRAALLKTNKDYDLVLTHLYLYYDMKLVTFGINDERNLIIQFPVFIQPYTQTWLVMYQIETVPIPILDKKEQGQSYTQLKINKPYIALNPETYITLCMQELDTCKELDMNIIVMNSLLLKANQGKVVPVPFTLI